MLASKTAAASLPTQEVTLASDSVEVSRHFSAAKNADAESRVDTVGMPANFEDVHERLTQP